MNIQINIARWWLSSVTVALVLVTSCARQETIEPQPSLDPPLTTETVHVESPPEVAAAQTVSYIRDIHPIMQNSCAACHLNGNDKGEYTMDTREKLVAGGWTGPAVIPGDAENSYLIQLLEDRADGIVMPLKGDRLTETEIQLFRDWIDEGAQWESAEDIEIAVQTRPLAIQPVVVPPPAGAPSLHPIDRILTPYMAKNKTVWKSIDDGTFARRAYLDTVGLLPDPEVLETFVVSPNPEKRANLVDQLLADNQGYAENWMTFWNDVLRNDFAGTGYIDGGRKQITNWLYNALYENKPYDRFVHELVSPDAEAEGFIKGIVWRGTTNASQTPPMQAAQNISQIFLATNLKCASCHDSFINRWKLSDAYGLATVFSEEELEIVRCDAPTGRMAEIHFLFPELGKLDGSLPRNERIEQLADILTKPENGRLARTIVNRLWARFFGRALVEPIDDLDSEPWHADLLEWLSADLIENDYDLRHTIRQIMTSKAYQLPSVSLGEDPGSDDYVFAGPGVRRMSAEQLIDSLSSLTGVWQPSPAANLNLVPDGGDAANLEDVLERASTAKWIWSNPEAATSAPAGAVYFRRDFNLPDVVSLPLEEAVLFLTADNLFTAYVNGKELSEGTNWNELYAVDLRPHLIPGNNTLAVLARNTAKGPAGLIAYARLQQGDEQWDFVSDADWITSSEQVAGWEKPEHETTEDWVAAAELGGAEIAPWNAQEKLSGQLTASLTRMTQPTRAWLTKSDPLMRALGRPNREQVVTRREPTATTLQAIEMTNGETLAGSLQKSAARVAADVSDPAEIVGDLYWKALARRPTQNELEIASGLVGSPVTAEGVEDLLWAILMHPEFQLIY